jgi:hypothetical protein
MDDDQKTEGVGKHDEITRMMSEGSMEDVAATFIRRSNSSRLTGEKRPVCAVSHEEQTIFAVNGKQIYSWDSLYRHVVNVGDKQKSDEVVAFEDEGTCFLAYLQSDMMKQPLNKADDFDFHCETQAKHEREQETLFLGALLRQLADAQQAMNFGPQ